MPPYWTARRILWTGVVVALGARLVVQPAFYALMNAFPFSVDVYGFGVVDVFGWLEAVISIAVWVGASMVAASFVVRVLEERGVVPAVVQGADADRANEL
ncbi:hypothetical protein ASE38_07400 [Cellulomonas sp. Root930]|nr:hypothetical protein ASE38_07400 [Cellulomonas sp. Root930]